MLSEEEKREIIEQAKEEILLILPEVMGNLMMNQAAMMKRNSEFYKQYPEFADHKDVVVSVMESIEGKSPLASHEERLKEAIPLIRERLAAVKKLDVEHVNDKIDRKFPLFNPNGNNGAL